MNKPCRSDLNEQFDAWLSERILSHLVHIQGLKYTVKLCGGLKTEADVHEKFLSGGRIVLEAKRAPGDESLLIRVWSIS